MITFMPEDDFAASAKLLDRQRLGKQRVEAAQLLNAIALETNRWTNSVAARMWSGYETALAVYGLTVCEEWRARGYRDTMMERILATFSCIDWDLPVEALNQAMLAEEDQLPWWVGHEQLHLSHRSNLVRKFPAYYRNFYPDVPDDLPYFWPEGRPQT